MEGLRFPTIGQTDTVILCALFFRGKPDVIVAAPALGETRHRRDRSLLGEIDATESNAAETSSRRIHVKK